MSEHAAAPGQLLVEDQDGVLRLTFNRPDAHQARTDPGSSVRRTMPGYIGCGPI
jgi:hypothetical protein